MLPGKRHFLKRGLLFAACCTLAFLARAFPNQPEVRFLRYSEVRETVQLFRGSGLPGSDITEAATWDKWIREQDEQVRSRIDRGVEDSISNLILYGTSYTSLPRLQSSEESVGTEGEISDEAKARVHALIAAIASPRRAEGERVAFVREFLARKGIAARDREEFLVANLIRFAVEQRTYQAKLEQAGKSQNTMDVLFARGTLYQQRGLSVDTSLLPNYAVEDTLRALASKGVVAPGKIRCVAVVGPGLDFADKRDGYDFYPLQTIQPFAIIEAVLRLKLSDAADLRLLTFDLNPAVNAHIRKLANEGAAGRAYVVQLPRDINADWSANSVSYWEHFGELIGNTVKPLPVPKGMDGITSRAVAVAPRYAARVAPMDLNIVAQTLNGSDEPSFDLVVATNILVYYDSFQQGIALASIGRLLNPGGIFIANTVLPGQHDSKMEFLGRRTVAYSNTGSYGDDVVVYRKR